MVGAIDNTVCGPATYVRNRNQEAQIVDRSCEVDVFVINKEANGINIVNVYYPLTYKWPRNVIKTGDNLPTIYTRDLNSHHSLCGYNNNDDNGEKLLE